MMLVTAHHHFAIFGALVPLLHQSDCDALHIARLGPRGHQPMPLLMLHTILRLPGSRTQVLI